MLSLSLTHTHTHTRIHHRPFLNQLLPLIYSHMRDVAWTGRDNAAIALCVVAEAYGEPHYGCIQRERERERERESER